MTKLRTEIILKDAKHVAFWFSFSFQVAIIRQQKTGNRALPPTHQTRLRSKAVFTKRRERAEKTKSGEDGEN